jgi:hypothetical protein
VLGVQRPDSLRPDTTGRGGTVTPPLTKRRLPPRDTTVRPPDTTARRRDTTVRVDTIESRSLVSLGMTKR